MYSHRAISRGVQVNANRALLWCAVIGFLCAASDSIAQKKPYYHEDLYSLRPVFHDPPDSLPPVKNVRTSAVNPTHTVNEKVNFVLDSINRLNVTRKFIEGFTIQIYSGQNRDEAMNVKKRLFNDAPDLNAELEYHQPKFRVRVGSYFSRLEAQKDLFRLKRPFPNAILVPEKILVR